MEHSYHKQEQKITAEMLRTLCTQPIRVIEYIGKHGKCTLGTDGINSQPHVNRYVLLGSRDIHVE